MRKILNRGAKRRLRRKQQSARRSRNRSIRGMEPLEDRRLLAVSPDGNWGQLFGPGSSLAGTVTREFTIPFGADAAIAVAANYTQSTSVSLAIDLDKDGSIDFLLDKNNAQLNGDPLDVGKAEEFVQGHSKMQVVGSEILNSTIWLIPIGANVMGRDVRVTLSGGVTTDFIATAGSYHGVDQKDPIGTVADNGSTATSFSLLSFGPVDEGDVTLDAVLVLGKTGIPVTDLAPDPLLIDASKVDQTEIFDIGHNPSANNFLRGAASFDDDDDTDKDALPNTVAMDWNFLPSGGVAGFAHAAVNINMTATPGVGFEFDFGDAPDTYPTTFAKNGPFHAPKGPTLGTLRDKEADAKLPLDGTGDDVNGDDEEGVTLFETNGGVVPPTPPNEGAFIFQQNGTNTGSVTVEVTGLDPDGKGGFVPAYVTGYIDFNDDGDFNDVGELVIKGEEVTKAGKVEYSFPIPSAAAGTKGGGTFMRVRLSNATMGDAKILPPGGHASSGEVEDYPIELVAGAEINGLKFEDLDADGVRDLGEPGLANVIIQLRDGANMPVKDLFNMTVKDVLTDANGKFAFANLKFGTYTVVEDLVNTDTNLDKVKDVIDTIAGITVKQGLTPSTPTSKMVILDAKTPINTEVLFGNFITGSIHGVKFHDLDGDGVFDDGEPRLGNIKFDLFKFIKTTVTVKATGGGTFTKYRWDDVGDAVTDVHGEFWFTDLVPGIYEVRETPDANLKQTTPQPTKSPNATDLNNDKDFVDAGEAGLDPATSLTKYEIISRREFVWQLGAASRIMDLDFDGAALVHPDGKIDQNEIDIAKAKGALKVEVLATPAVDAAPADKSQDLWFGNTLLSKIDGVKFENVDGSKDANGQPTFNTGDVLLAGVKMVLKDANGKETVVVTDADPDKDGKNFVFNGVVAGTYTVFESTATDTNNDKIADNTQEMDLDPFVETVAVTSGKNATLKHSFGNFVRGSIHGVKFDDLDGDGIWDKNRTGLPVEEPRLPGVKFDLYKFIKTTVKTPSSLSGPVTTYFWEDVGDATTDVHGEFWFTGLLAGKYEVRERAGQPFMQTTKQPTAPPDGKFNPATSTSLFEIVSRREFVWELDPTLVLAGGPGSDTANEQTQLKDAQSGAFNRPMDGVGGTKDGFIDSGEVLAAYNKAALKVQVLATPGQDEGEANAPGRDLWFGNVRAGQIVGFKYEDRDQSGTYDPAIDVPMKNVTMLLKGNDANGKLVELKTTTAADGSFSFGGLLPSDALGYNIFESDKTDTNNDGTPDSPDQELILDTTVANVVLSSGETKTLDKNLFANFILGSIHGVKFHDKDADGVKDPGEEPLKDVQFQLFKFTGTESFLLASNVTKTVFNWKSAGTAKTDSHGEFWFTGLEAGKYQVVENKGTMLPTTGQPTTSPVPVDNTGDGKFIDAKDFQGADPSKAASVFTIRSRWEYVWEFGASSRPRDLDGDGLIENGAPPNNEIQMAYNKSVLKTEILAAPNAPSTLFDSGGFEAPSYTTTAFGTGMLEGQPIGAPIVWQRTVNASPSTANIQNTVFAPGGGTQAVQMNRTAGAVDRWGLKFTNAPLTNTVTITWAMRVQGPAGNVATQFGPFFGVEAYDDTSGFIALIGSLGVDATTGDVLLQEATTGFFVETGATSAFGVWNNFEIRMNFTTKQYSVFFNGAFLRTEGFVDQANKPGGINRITDATLAGLTAAANSDALTGTAYFDNFQTKDIGAPAAPSLWFGNAFAGTITGFKYEDVDNNGKYEFNDLDKDGVQDLPGETIKDVPLGGASFILKDANGKQVGNPAVSGADGKFSFTNVLPGTYTVTESTATDTNGDKTADNLQDMVLDTRVANVTLASVSGGQTKDAGQFRDFVLGSIHGFKFQDFNGNGVRDPGESPWQGIKFDLFKLVKQETTLLASNKSVTVYTWTDVGDATTDIHGEFWFTGLDPGFYYTVREKENQNYEQTTPQLTKSPVAVDANKDGDFFDVGDFAGLDPLTKDNAGIPSSFFIYSRYEFQWATGAYNRPRDLNNDGIIDASEQTMAINKSVLKLPQPLADGKDGSPGNLIFGNMFVTGSIHGFKFEDIDADGVWDQSNPKGTGAEPGLGGIWIELRDAVTGKVATLANGDLAQTKTAGGDNPNTQRIEHKGEFWFVGVLPGTYTLNEILEKSDSNGDLIPDSQQGLVNSTPIQTGPITIGPRQEWVYKPGAAQLTPQQISKGIHEVFEDGTSANKVNEKLIFGNYITGSIHGFKFLDLNADGVYDPSAMGKERPFEWGVFELLDMSGKSLGIQFSNEDGEFWFTDLKPGKYTVRERPDLTDRNDIDGDGFPDMVDKNGDGFPESMGNGIPDTKEGLKLSTPIERTVQIWSREELVWQAGAAMLGGSSTVNVNNDKFAHLQNISNQFGNVTLSEAITGSQIYAVTPFSLQATSPPRVFGWDVGPQSAPQGFKDSFGFAGNAGIFQAQFAVPVTSVSIDVISNSGNDRGVLFGFDENGQQIALDLSALLNDTDVNPNNDWETLTVTAPAGKKIVFVQAGGDGLSASDVGLDNLQYVVDPLKEEKIVGTQLMWGNFYAGAIHGLKLQQDTNKGAPNIPIKLINQSGQTVASTTTNANGEFWFLDVVPGFYTIAENPTPSVIIMAMPVPVVVGHAQVVVAPGATAMPYPGLQTTVSNQSLVLRNLIEGSIHGLVCNQNNQPIAGVTVVLAGPENAQTTTNAQGQFHFNDLTPGAYAVNVNGIIRVVIVGSGEEEVAMAGLASPLDPGQFETLNPDLKIILNQPGGDTAGPRVASVKVVSSQWTEPFLDEVDPVDGEGYPIPTGADQLKTLPWININEVLVEFTESMNIVAADISLHGVSVANYATAFNYDAPSRTASIQLTGGNFIGADKLVLHINDTAKDLAGNALDGEWVNGVSTYANMGNGTAGGDFNYRLNVLPGDARQDGQNLGAFDGVLGTDVIKVRNAQFLTTTDATYSPFDDVNGSGNVSGVDVVAVRNRQFTGLPVGNPVAPPASGASLVDSVFGNGASFGKGDDDDLLLALATGSGSSADDVFESAVGGDSDGEAGAVGSIDDLFAALGS